LAAAPDREEAVGVLEGGEALQASEDTTVDGWKITRDNAGGDAAVGCG
jgi:hypothetical protein